MADTHFRADLRAALLGVLTEFYVENPGLLRAVHPARPEGVSELPVAWVGNLNEVITHDSGTRQRAFRPSVVILDHLTENAATVQRLDVIVDALVDRFTLAVRRIHTTIIEIAGVTDSEVQIGEATYRTVEISFDRTIIREGRS